MSSCKKYISFFFSRNIYLYLERNSNTRSIRQLTTYSLEKGLLAPRIASNAWVAQNAVLIGNVIVKEEASIWFNAIVRADNDLITIGERVNIQDGCILHTDAGIPLTLWEGVTVGHMAKLHGCTVHKNSLIGIGATLLNKSVVGENCLIAANAIVTEGTIIPDYSLVVGVNKIVRQLNTNEIEKNKNECFILCQK